MAAHFEVGRRLRVLDVGLGHGTQALRLARAGHRVTGLESDPERLAQVESAVSAEPEGIRERFRTLAAGGQDTGAHFLPGTFDLVLCHDALPLEADPSTTLAGLARVLDSGGLLSLVVENALAAPIPHARAGRWDAALAEFDGRDRPLLGVAELESLLERIGTPVENWFGVEVFAAEDAPADDERLLAVEERAGRTEPYRRLAGRLHLCAVRG
ncbi:methyltransferase domain-containing protein [Streptomyces sulphureus]|uniref:methyltransferase domain-containing protein n=1 Tax=Streptomyces sulphureus TaxID=47758 RepID=UPI003CCB788E